MDNYLNIWLVPKERIDYEWHDLVPAEFKNCIVERRDMK